MDLLRTLRARECLAALEDLRAEAASLVSDDAADVRSVAVHAERRARDDAAALLPDPRLLGVLEEHEDVRAGEAAWTAVKALLVGGDQRRDDRCVVVEEQADVHASTFSQTTCSESTTIPTLSYSFVARLCSRRRHRGRPGAARAG